MAPPWTASANARFVLALAPTEHQARQRRHFRLAHHFGKAGQAQFDGQGQHALVQRVLQQRSHASQQHQHADLHRHVAHGEPALHRTRSQREHIRRGRRRRGGRTRRRCSSGTRRCRNRRRRDGGRNSGRHRRQWTGLRFLHAGLAGQLGQGGLAWHFHFGIWNIASGNIGTGRSVGNLRRVRRRLWRAGGSRSRGGHWRDLQAIHLAFQITDAALEPGDRDQRDDQQDRHGQQRKSQQYQQTFHSTTSLCMSPCSLGYLPRICNPQLQACRAAAKYKPAMHLAGNSWSARNNKAGQARLCSEQERLISPPLP